MFTKFRRPQKKSETTRLTVPIVVNGRALDVCLVYYTLYSERFRKGGYFLSGDFPGLGVISAKSRSSIFHALFCLRERIEGDGIRIAVWGAKESVWPSGMSADMGGGFLATDRASQSQEMKEIFEAIPISEAATTKEQQNWQETWS